MNRRRARKSFFAAIGERARYSNRRREIESVRKLRRAVGSVGLDSVPVNLTALGSELGVSHIRYAPLPVRGRLVLEGGRIIIEINEHDPRWLQRYTHAHELAHVVIEESRLRYAMASGFAQVEHTELEYQSLENICDRMAEELLLPEHWLLERVDFDAPSLAWASEIATEIRMSVEFVTRRVIDLGLWQASLLTWSVGVEMAQPIRGSERTDEWLLASSGLRLDDTAAELLVRSMTTDQVVVGELRLRAGYDESVVHSEALALDSGTILTLSQELQRAR
jgi:Zn-dependent peptidase ImmA (M78 family)